MPLDPPTVEGMAIRTAFVASAPVVRDLVAACADRWDDRSALDGMSIGDLAAHTARAILNVERYLETDGPTTSAPLDAAGYFLAIDGLSDHESAISRDVRSRATAEASDGPEAVLARLDDTIDRFTERLPAEPSDRTISVFGGIAMRLDDYLTTRLVEIVVHADDLTASLDLPEPTFEPAVTDMVIDVLVTMARRTHGDLAVIRSMTRRERDIAEALRVL